MPVNLLIHILTALRILIMAAVIHCSFIPVVLSQDSKGYIITHRLLDVESGMASQEVLCGLQDNDGFLWFGTRNGLNRYDGKNFQVFTKQQDKLRENRVIKLALDYDGHMFILYGEGGNLPYSIGKADVMDLATQKIQPLNDLFPTWPFKEADIYWITNDGSGDLCIVTKNPYKLWRYSKSKGLRMQTELGETKRGDWPYPGAYTLFHKGRAVINFNSTKPTYFITADSTYSLPPIAGHSRKPLYITSDTSFVYCEMGSAYPHEEIVEWSAGIGLRRQHQVQALLSGEKEGLQVLGSTNDTSFLIVPASKGLFLQSRHNSIKLLSPQDLEEFPSMAIYQGFTGNEGTRYICTSVGVLQINARKNRFTHFFTKDQTGFDKANQARGIFTDAAGTIYTSAWNILFSAKLEDSILPGKFKTVQKIELLFYALFQMNNSLYVGASGYIMKYDRQHNQLEQLEALHTDIWSIDQLNDSTLLLGTGAGIYLFNTVTNKSKLAAQVDAIPTANFVYRFIPRGDTIWAVAERGLFALDKQGKICHFFGQSNNNGQQFPAAKLYDAYIDNKGIAWLATNGDGLYKWDRKTNTLKQFSLAEGFPSNILYRIESDEHGNLWISSDYGLIRFNTEDLSVVTYTKQDGISHNEFNRASSFKEPGGKLYFGGLDGVNVFDPKEFSQDKSELDIPLRIISLFQYSSAEDKLVDGTRHLLKEGKIILQPGDRFINIEYQLLDFENTKHQYAYKIEGLDEEWNQLNENSIRLSGLPYGDYTLLVKGKKLGGQWSNTQLKIPIVVQRPITRTWWFLTIILIAVFILLLIIYRWRTRVLLKAKLALETTVENRTQELRNLLGQKDLLMKEIHHRVKNNLQVIISLLDLQRARSKDDNIKFALRESQNRVLSIAIIHQNLYQQDDLKGVEMHHFADELSKHIKGIFEKEQFPVVIDNNFESVYLDIDTAVPLGLILNELLTNSFKHGLQENMDNRIQLLLQQTGEGNYYFKYSDSGKGLPPGQSLTSGSSMGLRLVTGLAKQIAGEMQYRYDHGSIFEMQFKNFAERSNMA